MKVNTLILSLITSGMILLSMAGCVVRPAARRTVVVAPARRVYGAPRRVYVTPKPIVVVRRPTRRW